MRLAQLARKLSLKPAEIHSFLVERGHTLELNPNSRLTEDQVLIAVRKFDPSIEAAILQESATADMVEPLVEPVDLQPVVEDNPEQPDAGSEQVVSPGDESGIQVQPEVIRAPKTELPGLRVVGKIELKDPKKKETTTEATEAPTEPSETTDQRPVRAVRPPRREQAPREWKNPLEAQRQREAREREEKRERQIELEKQRRTQNYLKKVKSVPTKPVKRAIEEAAEVVEDTRPAPRTWLGKFARWLTT